MAIGRDDSVSVRRTGGAAGREPVTGLPGDDARLLGESRARVAELEVALARAETAMQIVSQTNSLLDRELFKSTIIAKVGEIAADILDYDRMADGLLGLVGRLVDYDVAGLLLLQSSPALLNLKRANGAVDGLLDSFAASVLVVAVEETGRALADSEFERRALRDDVESGSAGRQERAVGAEVRSFHCAVLRVGEEVLGMLAMGSSRPGAFGAGDVESFDLIAAQSAIVVDDAARHRALEVSRRRIEELHGTARALEACETEAGVYHITVGAVKNIFNSVECCLDVVDDGHLVCCETSLQSGAGELESMPLESGGVEQSAHQSGQTVPFNWSGDVAPSRKLCEFRCGLAIPVGARAVLLLQSAVCHVEDGDSTRLVELLCGHAGEALQRIRLRDELREQAIRDPLTGAFNRRYFDEHIQLERSRAARSGAEIGFLIIDIDDFKQVNDTRGHDVGDEVLIAVVALLRANTRDHDMVVRSGGDEFLVVLSESEGALEVAHRRIGAAIEHWTAEAPLGFSVGLSVGCIGWNPASGVSLDDTLKQADDLMYQEKRRRKSALAKEAA